jgi:hypothetical protein
MPDIGLCIIGKAGGEEGDISLEQANGIVAKFTADVAEVMETSGKGLEEAQRIVAARMPDEMDRGVLRRKRMALKQMAAQSIARRIADDAAVAGMSVEQAMKSMLTVDPSGAFRNHNLHTRIQTVENQAFSRNAELLSKMRSKNLGLSQDLSDLPDMVREMMNVPTGNRASKEMAEALIGTLEHLRLRYNAAGGDIAFRKDHGLPISHDRVAIASASEDDWVNFTFDELDRAKMLDDAGEPLSEAQIRKILHNTYVDITTQGMDLETGPRGFGSSVTRRAEARFLAFRGPDAWMKYHEKFGTGNVLDHINGSIRAMSRDIAELEILGPYPEATIELMESLSDIDARRAIVGATGKKARKLAERIGLRVGSISAVYKFTTGRSAVPARADVAKVGQGVRNISYASLLGQAIFSGFSDVATVAITARFNGMPVMKTVGKMLATFATNDQAVRRQLVRSQVGIHSWVTHANTMQRFMGESTGPEITRRIADGVIRATGLGALTDAGRMTFGGEFQGVVTEAALAGNTWGRLAETNGALRRSMERQGITEVEWDLIRSTKPFQDPETGVISIRPGDVQRGQFSGASFDAANKYGQMMTTEGQFAVITSDPRIQALLIGDNAPGTFIGEVLRSTAMLKSFIGTFTHMHYARALAQPSKWGTAQYAGSLLVGMTVMGALGEQLGNLTAGKDPEDMMDPGFLSRAMLRGGALSVLGEMALQDNDGWGDVAINWAAGPVVGKIAQATDITFSNVQKALKGEDTKAAWQISQFIYGTLPGNNYWATKLATERLFKDTIREWTDPDAHAAFRRIEKKARDDKDQSHFWGRGDATPDRAPDLSAALPFIK